MKDGTIGVQLEQARNQYREQISTDRQLVQTDNDAPEMQQLMPHMCREDGDKISSIYAPHTNPLVTKESHC